MASPTFQIKKFFFWVLGSTLLVWQVSCQGDLLALYKNSLAPGKWTGALLHPDWWELAELARGVQMVDNLARAWSNWSQLDPTQAKWVARWYPAPSKVKMGLKLSQVGSTVWPGLNVIALWGNFVRQSSLLRFFSSENIPVIFPWLPYIIQISFKFPTLTHWFWNNLLNASPSQSQNRFGLCWKWVWVMLEMGLGYAGNGFGLCWKWVWVMLEMGFSICTSLSHCPFSHLCNS